MFAVVGRWHVVLGIAAAAVMSLCAHTQAQEQRREYFKGGTGLRGTRQGQKVTAKGVAFEAPLGDGSTVFLRAWKVASITAYMKQSVQLANKYERKYLEQTKRMEGRLTSRSERRTCAAKLRSAGASWEKVGDRMHTTARNAEHYGKSTGDLFSSKTNYADVANGDAAVMEEGSQVTAVAESIRGAFQEELGQLRRIIQARFVCQDGTLEEIDTGTTNALQAHAVSIFRQADSAVLGGGSSTARASEAVTGEQPDEDRAGHSTVEPAASVRKTHKSKGIGRHGAYGMWTPEARRAFDEAATRLGGMDSRNLLSSLNREFPVDREGPFQKRGENAFKNEIQKRRRARARAAMPVAGADAHDADSDLAQDCDEKSGDEQSGDEQRDDGHGSAEESEGGGSGADSDGACRPFLYFRARGLGVTRKRARQTRARSNARKMARRPCGGALLAACIGD